jgi:UDPglucose 6-dehydrogenase
VRNQLETISGFIKPGTLVLISSQVPVGFTCSLERNWGTKQLTYAYSPENLRLGKSLHTFRNPERIVIGIRNQTVRATLTSLLLPFCNQLIWMSVESAEMTKHAVNAFLATSVTFINELAQLCEVVGADAKEVERGLKSEGRIGARAYLSPGGAFAGGTLARDLRYLISFGEANHVGTPLFNGVLQSNSQHSTWTSRTLTPLLRNCSNPVVSILGLTYTPNTSTLRRSASIELAQWLHERGVRVQAHDPAVVTLPNELQSIIWLYPSAAEALTGSDAVVIGTEWPAFRELQSDTFVLKMRQPQMIDPNWFLQANIIGDNRITYFAIGKGSTCE